VPDTSVETVLAHIIRQYGRSIIDEPQLCGALLRDLCPENRREVNVLLTSLREGVATELVRTSQGALVELFLGGLANRLESEHALNTHAARWAVESWALALGCITENQATISSMDAPMHSTGLEFVRIPAGEFLYGEEKERKSLPEFSITKYPVTVRQYRLFCQVTNRKMPVPPSWGWIDDHPMVNVTWHDAAAFAQWAGGSLPTERQWEKAARGTDGREYPWGNTFDESKCVCSVGKKDSASTAPVGSCPAGASPYGCMDMAGNVYEWCEDWYDSSKEDRVLRGGYWSKCNAGGFRAAYSNRSYPDYASDIGGFRVVFQGSA